VVAFGAARVCRLPSHLTFLGGRARRVGTRSAADETPMTFRRLSIKRKLMLITMLTSSPALLLALAAFLVYDLAAARARMSRDLATEAEIIGRNCMVALAVHDEQCLEEILGALRDNRQTVAAAVYTRDGGLLAAYRRDSSDTSAIPRRPEAIGTRFAGTRLIVFHPIVPHGQTLGTLYVGADMRQWRARMIRDTGIVAVLMVGSAVIAFLLASRLQADISMPIVELEKIAALLQPEAGR
jgi:uncharacterized membrane protein affecting hemolysin expression